MYKNAGIPTLFKVSIPGWWPFFRFDGRQRVFILVYPGSRYHEILYDNNK